MSVEKPTDDWVAGPRVILINRNSAVCCGAFGGKNGKSFCVGLRPVVLLNPTAVTRESYQPIWPSSFCVSHDLPT